MLSPYRAVAKIPQSAQLGGNVNWLTFLSVATQKKTQRPYFRGHASLHHGAEPLRLILTVLRAYNNGIQLQKVPVTWRKITNDRTWAKFQVYCPIPWDKYPGRPILMDTSENAGLFWVKIFFPHQFFKNNFFQKQLPQHWSSIVGYVLFL